MKSGYETVVDALEAGGYEGSWIRDRRMYHCPAHDDDRPSLSVSEGDDGRSLVYCFAGCKTEDVISALGLEWKDLFGTEERVPVAEYVYVWPDGKPHIKVTRYQPKGFTQARWEDGVWVDRLEDVPRIPYNLDLVYAAPKDETIYIVEGEKDAETLVACGVVATTFLGGAGKWRDEYAKWFEDRRVVVIADADDPGRIGAERIYQKLLPVVSDIRLTVPPVGKDVTDLIMMGMTLDDLEDMGDGLDEFGPLDWEHYETSNTEWLLEPYVPRGGRVLVFGPAGSLKSLWAMWLAAHVAKDGGKVAYFSLEMLPSVTAQRLKRLAPPKDRFVCFTKDFRLGSPSHTEKLVRGLKDYDLIVVDSWTAARRGLKDSNEQVAELDTEFFLPVIKHTGASILVIDNTGHPAVTDRGLIKMEHARGASAKGDKMDVTIFFDRPYADNNYLTKIEVKKMRYDRPIPEPVVVFTPTDTIEFYFEKTHKPMWPGLDIMAKPEPTPLEKAAEARLKDRFKAIG